MFLKRLGSDSYVACSDTAGCPDIWELNDGDFAIIGTDITDDAKAKLPVTAGCASGERIIRLPRRVLVSAKQDIPDRV